MEELEETNEALLDMISSHKAQLATERRHDMKHDASSANSALQVFGASPAPAFGGQPKQRATPNNSPLSTKSRTSMGAQDDPSHIAEGDEHHDLTGSAETQRQQFTLALNSACWKGKLKTVEYLLSIAPSVFAGIPDHDIDPASPLKQSADAAADTADQERGPAVALRAALNTADAHGQTPLLCATHRDHLKVVDLLLSHNARCVVLPASSQSGTVSAYAFFVCSQA